jgi:peptidoglycan L-alanyl-D-glutamate endopeptidase CwlK
MGNFFTDIIQRDPRYLSTDPVNDVALLEPGFRAKAQAFVDAAFAQGIELVSTETYRSSQRQQQLFDEGKTQLRLVGVHHYGLALDFAKRIGGKESWEGDWTFMGPLAAAHGAVAGADWGEPEKPHTFRDWDHLQGVTIAEQKGLLAGTWYPGAAVGVGGVAPLPGTVASAGPPIAPPAIPAGLTQQQAKILAIADQVNRDSFANWFARASVMAFVEIESDFNEVAIRHESSGVTSYGLMQVLDSTAAGLGLAGDAAQMFDAATSLFYGMKYAAQGWNYLVTHLGRPPTLVEWSAGYNEGYGAAGKGRADPGYTDKWTAAHDRWAAILVDAAPPYTVERRLALRRAADLAAYAGKAPGQITGDLLGAVVTTQPAPATGDLPKPAQTDPGGAVDAAQAPAGDAAADDLNRGELDQIIAGAGARSSL